MRFSITGEHQRNPLLRAIVLLFMGYIALFWLSNGLMYFHKMGLTPGSVTQYYLGSEENFTQPISYQSLLEVLHFHLFSMGILVLILTHLMLFVPFSMRLKVWLIGLTFFSAVANEAGGWLVRFVHPGFAYFKIGAFLLLEGTLATLVIVVGGALLAGKRNAYREAHAPSSHKRHGHRHGHRKRLALDPSKP
jgi:hypothetical protein